MSLRLRLTLLYSTLVGGILLVFGAAVYILISIILLDQVDNSLATTARDIMSVTAVNSAGEVSAISLPSLELTANTYVQGVSAATNEMCILHGMYWPRADPLTEMCLAGVDPTLAVDAGKPATDAGADAR